MGYTGNYDPERMARATGKELHISPKHSVEICRAIRGLPVTSAIDMLEAVERKEEAIPFRRYNKCVPHQRTRGPYKKKTGPGRFPVKASKAIRRIILSAQENAERQIDDLADIDDLKIATAAASRGRVIKGWTPRAHGRWNPWNEDTTNIEIILEMTEE